MGEAVGILSGALLLLVVIIIIVSVAEPTVEPTEQSHGARGHGSVYLGPFDDDGRPKNPHW